jgi:hypothetical protein
MLGLSGQTVTRQASHRASPYAAVDVKRIVRAIVVGRTFSIESDPIDRAGDARFLVALRRSQTLEGYLEENVAGQ